MWPNLFWMLGWMGEEAFPTPSSPCAGKTRPNIHPSLSAESLQVSAVLFWDRKMGRRLL